MLKNFETCQSFSVITKKFVSPQNKRYRNDFNILSVRMIILSVKTFGLTDFNITNCDFLFQIFVATTQSPVSAKICLFPCITFRFDPSNHDWTIFMINVYSCNIWKMLILCFNISIEKRKRIEPCGIPWYLWPRIKWSGYIVYIPSVWCQI